jgi:LCP family protein required for cell wall assembly
VRGFDQPPRLGLALLKRALVAGVLIVLATAGAVSAAVILQVDQAKEEFLGEGRQQIEIPEITRAQAGGPRTVLILGSDKRWGDSRHNVRSDTILLARVDPDNEAITVMSVPRDLKAAFRTARGDWVEGKINQAYGERGPSGTASAVKRLLSGPGRPFEINNVVNVNFGGFRRAVNAIGGVYVDVDRRYFNDNAGVPRGQTYATIDVKPGYQKLKGQDALDYVRYRHTDNDLVRAARQQDFLRQAKDQSGTRRLLSFGGRHELAKIFKRYVQVDSTLRSTRQIFSLIRLAIFVQDKQMPVREIPFPVTGDTTGQPGEYFLFSSRDAIDHAVDEFMAGRQARGTRQDSGSARRATNRGRRSKRASSAAKIPAGLERTSRAEGETFAIKADKDLDFRFYWPSLGATNAVYARDMPLRTYTLRDEQDRPHDAYRLVIAMDGVNGKYYGVQGTTWRDPPILDGPHETLRRDGRSLRVYYDGPNVRLVAWRTPKAVYWVSNTLTRDLRPSQMIAIAGSLTRLGQK